MTRVDPIPDGTAIVKGFRCGGCKEFFEDEPPPQYVCSRCGHASDDADETRCPACGIFMRKEAEQHCECGEDDNFTEVEVLRFDGEYFETLNEVHAYIANTPKREREKKERDRKHAEWMKKFEEEQAAKYAQRDETLDLVRLHFPLDEMPNFKRYLYIEWTDGVFTAREARDIGESVWIEFEELRILLDHMIEDR
jgi:DNA-directed RNA polymerase subunit RPC12/RpoP